MTTVLKTTDGYVKHWFAPLLGGVFLACIGVYTLFTPIQIDLAIPLTLSIVFILVGIFETYFAFRNREHMEGWPWYLSGGIISVMVGVIAFNSNQLSIAVLPFVIGASLFYRSLVGLNFAHNFKRKNLANWANLGSISLMGIIFSFLMILTPFYPELPFMAFTSLAFIFSGISAIVLPFDLRRSKEVKIISRGKVINPSRPQYSKKIKTHF